MSEERNVIVPIDALRHFRLPGSQDRISIIGRTGSGKTHFASWVLAQSSWPTRPWVIIDYKRDELLAQLPAHEIGLEDKRLPRQPGLYIVHPIRSQDDAVERLLNKIWAKERMGLYVDEGHMLPDRGGLEAVLTQGRSKHIPAIVLSQRPVWLNRYVLSEADFYAVFHLNHKKDRVTVGEFMPEAAQQQLPEHHSWYYDVGHNRLWHLRPVPDRDHILGIFDRRNPRRSRGRML